MLGLDAILTRNRPNLHRSDPNRYWLLNQRQGGSLRPYRENMQLHQKQDFKTLFNDSINQTLTRTINTSTSTLIVLLCIFFLGGESIRSFSFAMSLGVIVGTLSSIFVAAPIAFLTLGKQKGKDVHLQK